MPRKFTQDTILLASNNENKLQELLIYFSALPNKNIKFLKPNDFGIVSPEETESTFEGNAELKAKYYGAALNVPALADDTGVCVEALGGSPGVHTARWIDTSSDDFGFRSVISRVERELKQIGNEEQFPKAKAVCALSLYWPDNKHIETFVGEMHGHLDFSYKNNVGIGFQPVFVPDGSAIPFGEMSVEQKQLIGHRGKAFQKLLKACF